MRFNLFTWWAGSTFGTWLYTRRNGREVGRDADGNIYYESADGRRWVIYARENEATQVPPEWHLWLHKTRHAPPTDVPLPVRTWEKPWRPNPTGSERAELPSGAITAGGKRQSSAADYRPWTPGS